ncbi:MAG: caspase family protein [Bacteroidota bacterium]
MEWYFSLLMLICIPFQTYSQTNQKPEKPRPGDYALFFAVNEYDSLDNLSNPVSDAEKISSLLEENYGFQVKVVKNPDFRSLKKTLQKYEDNFRKGILAPDGQLFIFFSGHGKVEYDNGFFLPRDADPDDLTRTAFTYEYLRGLINSLKCKHIFVAVDACFSVHFDPNFSRNSGSDRPGEMSTAERLINNHAKYKSRIFFTSDVQEEETPDRSNFSKQIQEGLINGGGKDKILTINELFTFVEQATPTPHKGRFGDDEAGSNFLFLSKELNAQGSIPFIFFRKRALSIKFF